MSEGRDYHDVPFPEGTQPSEQPRDAGWMINEDGEKIPAMRIQPKSEQPQECIWSDAHCNDFGASKELVRYEFIRDNDVSHGAIYEMRKTPNGRFVTFDAHNAALVAAGLASEKIISQVMADNNAALAASKHMPAGEAAPVIQKAIVDLNKRVIDLDKQLAAEREKVAEVERLAKGNITGCGTCHSVLNALAKVKEGESDCADDDHAGCSL